MSTPATVAVGRTVVLEQAAVDAARSWVAACCAELAGQGRRVEGGWPGTIGEARARVAAEAMRVLGAPSMTQLSHLELGRLAQITYKEARHAWTRSTKAGTRR
jgi:LmbE family N-acetylglucosaminyl deacetylase